MMKENRPEVRIILVDKPKGPASLEVVERACRALGVSKAGHAGTLDPNATGLLVIALGEARKAMPVLCGLDKEYEGVMLLHGDVAQESVKDALSSFRGRITQLPPVKSAVARKERQRTVHELQVTGIDGRRVGIRVLCEAGTYIRKIASDAGEKLSCGAHLAELRRTRVGPFSVKDAVALDALEKNPGKIPAKAVMPLGEALARTGLPKMTVTDESVEKIRKGSPVRKEFVTSVSGEPAPGDYVGVYDSTGRIICLGKFSGEGNTAARTERVFLQHIY